MPQNSAVTRLSIAKNHENTIRQKCAPVTTSKKEVLTPFAWVEECKHLHDHVRWIVRIDAAQADHADDHKMTFTKIPVLIAESTEGEKLPIMKPRDAQDTISKQ